MRYSVSHLIKICTDYKQLLDIIGMCLEYMEKVHLFLPLCFHFTIVLD